MSTQISAYPNVQPGETDEAYPEVFITPPPQPKEKKPGQLSKEQLKQYFEEGYLVLDDFFDISEDLDPCREAVADLVDTLAKKLYEAGKIKKLYSEYGLFERLTLIDKEFPGANIVLTKWGNLPKAIQNLWSNERLLNMVEQLIGPDIAGHPVWNLRTKTPKNEATTVPWHQDVGYLDDDSYKVLQPTAWIPLLDANENNGCVQVVRGGHRTGKICRHECCAGSTWYVMIAEGEMEKKLGVDLEDDIVSCPVPYGGMLLINNLIPHRSLNNYSNQIRWSLDLRWQTPNMPNGFYGMKDSILMRSSKDPDLKPDWDSFIGVERTKKQEEYVEKPFDEFDTTIVGPWMKRWSIVHHNRHTKSIDLHV